MSSSLVLETPVTTICSFLFRPNDSRLKLFFRAITTALTNLLNDKTPQSGEQLRVGLTASLAVLLQIVELRQTAQILED